MKFPSAKPALFLLFLLFLVSEGKACMYAYQFKMFPVGTVKENILSIDFKLVRTETFSGTKRLKIANPYPKEEMAPMWMLYSYIATYDKNQKLVSCIPFDTSYILKGSYNDTLQKMYDRAFLKIKKDQSSIELFTPEYLSFCDYQQQCKKVGVVYDTVDLTNYLIYEKKKIAVPSLTDTSYYALDKSSYHQDRIDGYGVSSVRILKNKKMTIVLTHIASGHEMTYRTTDPKLAGKENEDGITLELSKEYSADFPFKEIHKSAYEEPIMHHGYGIDLFITVK